MKWAEDEEKMGFSGPPSELGWADHEEIVAQLTASVAFFRDQALEWRTEAERLKDGVRKAWEVLYAAISDDSPVIQQGLQPGHWQTLKYGALDAMHTLEAARGSQSMSRKRERP